MTAHKIGTREEWLAARLDLLSKVGKRLLITAEAKAAWLASRPASAIKQASNKALPHQSCSNPRTIPAEIGAKRG
jgi:hypothetical protein